MTYINTTIIAATTTAATAIAKTTMATYDLNPYLNHKNATHSTIRPSTLSSASSWFAVATAPLAVTTNTTMQSLWPLFASSIVDGSSFPYMANITDNRTVTAALKPTTTTTTTTATTIKTTQTTAIDNKMTTATATATTIFTTTKATTINDTFNFTNYAQPVTTTTTTSKTSIPTETAITSSSTIASASLSSLSIDAYLMAMSWSELVVVAVFIMLILVTVMGNTLVILSILTTRRLRTVTNCFVLNLAITDWLVGTCVMPPAAILYIEGDWHFGWILCDIWISLDVLLCTASILSLCAISLDRYLAVTRPLTYSKNKRTKRLAFIMIFIVWITALLITCPPYLGWYEPDRHKADGYVECRYNQNKGYVVFSAMGSFFIPLTVMLYVYLKIGYVLNSRRQCIVRDADSERLANHDIEVEQYLSDSEHCPQKLATLLDSIGSMHSLNVDSSKLNKCHKKHTNYTLPHNLQLRDSLHDLVKISRFASTTPTNHSCKKSKNDHYIEACNMSPHGKRFSLTDICTTRLHGGGVIPDNNKNRNGAAGSGAFSEACLARIITGEEPQCEGHAVQINNKSSHQQQQQRILHKQHHHHHQQRPRMPMRVSTTKRETKTAKTLTIVMGGFIICWLPFFIYYLLMPFVPPPAIVEGLMSTLTWVGWVNCAINPFIYAFYNADFRTAFWRLTCRCLCNKKPKQRLQRHQQQQQQQQHIMLTNQLNMFKG